jgi:hypothetical protein
MLIVLLKTIHIIKVWFDWSKLHGW